MHSDANLSVLMITITVVSVATHQSSVECFLSGWREGEAYCTIWLSVREDTTTDSPLLPLSEKCRREDRSSTLWEQ